ncbi:uncharacterized protein [Lolium perenne]|uniref:uncharacterized protein isoform X1 n=1 Tax=Lolium perenne TaxID=4522 RepID=UPI0021F690A5|nr:uncharacterized protein LOC127327886 isoform X1 [Lolium perenne]
MAAALRRLAGSASLEAARGLASGIRGLHPPAAVSRIQARRLRSEATPKSPLVQIAETKEELYRLMADNAELIGRGNLGLVKQLALHVEPKPHDPTWRFYRRAKMVNTTLFYSCFLFGGVISAYHRSEE